MDESSRSRSRAPETSRTYDYYFHSDRAARPEFVTKLLFRKHRMLLDLALQPRTRSMVEVGPGEGFVAREARARGLEYLAIESSPRGVAQLQEQGVDVHQATIPPFPDTTPRVDLLYASHLVEHLGGPDEVLKMLLGAKEILTPGGAVALVFPDYNWMKKAFWDCDYTHQWPSTPRRVAQVAHDAGFRVLRQAPCCLHLNGPAALGLRVLMKLYPHRLLSFLDRTRSEFWFRGSLLFAPDHIVVLTPMDEE